MSPEKTKLLVDNYPLIFSKIKHVECSDGWYHLLNSLCGVIENIAKQIPLELQGQIHASQIKQKFGGLRFYLNHNTPAIEGAIDLAEELSNNMCEVCGNYGGHKNINGWITTLCDIHHKTELAAYEERMSSYKKKEKK